MTIFELAQRLQVHESHITAVEEIPAGFVVTLRSGQKMLVSPTVARVYVPEVDDEPTEEFATGGLVTPGAIPVIGEDGPPPMVVPDKPKAAKKATPKAKQQQ